MQAGAFTVPGQVPGKPGLPDKGCTSATYSSRAMVNTGCIISPWPDNCSGAPAKNNPVNLVSNRFAAG